VVLPAGSFRPMLSRLWKTRQTPMADIFISYATVDRPLARRLADALEARGWSVWWDHSNLHGGQHFDRVIEKAICGARVVIVVWSKTSVESGWVRDEATLALEEQKLVPLRIDMIRLPMRFRNIHTIDLSSWTGETEAEPFERLVKDLGHYLGPPTPANGSEHLGIPATPDPRTAAPLGEDEQPTETPPIAERSQASPGGGSPHASTIATQPTSTIDPPPRAGRKRMVKYFAAIAVTVGVVWGMVALEERQPPSVKPSTEASPPDSTRDARPQAAESSFKPADFTVYIQYPEDMIDTAKKMQNFLINQGYHVPGIEQTLKPPSRLQVRYYRPNQKIFAGNLATQLGQALSLRATDDNAILVTSPRELPSGILEVWLPPRQS
jgi:hypothetical protein